MASDSVLLTILPLLVVLALGGLVIFCYQKGPRLQWTIESLLAWISHRVKQGMADYVDVETVDAKDTFVLKDGSLMTLIKVHGTFQLIGTNEFAAIDQALSSNLGAYFQSGGHELHVIYQEDPDNIERVIREKLKPSMDTARRLQLDLDDLFDEDVRTLSKYCSHEDVYLVLLTRPKALSKQDLKKDLAAKLELLKSHPLPSAADAPHLFAAIRALRTRHHSFVDQLASDLRLLRVDAEVMEVHHAAKDMRSSADPDFTANDWRACLFGDKFQVRRSMDASGWLWPRLDSQLIPRDGQEVDLKTVQVGDRIYAPMHVTLQPSEIKPFMVLFKRVRETRMPWRITWRVTPDGIRTMSLKSILGALLGWTSNENQLIEQGIQYVRDLVRGGEAMDVTLRVDFMTWAPAGKVALLRDRAARLARAVQGWGGADTAEVAGDIHEAFVANCVGMRTAGIGPVSCAPLSDVTPMLPMYRPTSPWREGSVLYRTDDGKPWPYQPNSPVQTSWITLMYAEMRSGKTLNGNQINLAMCLSPGLTRLPMIGIIDIGRGSAGLVSLLQHALPDDQKHLATSFRLRMTPEYAVNPFDTQLGARYPLPNEKVFHKNFVLTLVTTPGKDTAEDGMSGLAELAVEYAYKYYAEKAPKPYVAGAVDEVDEAIANFRLPIDERTTWWEVVDDLFEKGAYHAATVAQRYAMPTLTDVASLSRESIFSDVYGQKKLSDQEPLQGAFARRLSESIRSYPILDKPTRFDIGLARVVSIDLDEVAKSAGSETMKRQTAIMYMLARQIIARNFFLHTDDLKYFPPAYREFQGKRIREIMQDKKHLQYDEFHVTGGIKAVQEQVVSDMRVTGKHGVQITLISQSVEDFHPTMLEFATSKFVLSRANKSVADKMKQVFSMSATALYAVQNEIRPPTKDGSYFLGIFKTKASEADAVQLLRNTVGGIKLWAFTTTNEDVIVRDALYERIGPVETRRFLAKLYPGGSILQEIEVRKKKMSESTMIDAENSGNGVISDLIEDLVKRYETMKQQALAARVAGERS